MGVVLLHGGSQAGDPAILQRACSSVLVVQILQTKIARDGGGGSSNGVGAESGQAATYVALEGTLENQLLSHWEMRQSGRLSGERKVRKVGVDSEVTPLTLGALAEFRNLCVGEKKALFGLRYPTRSVKEAVGGAATNGRPAWRQRCDEADWLHFARSELHVTVQGRRRARLQTCNGTWVGNDWT